VWEHLRSEVQELVGEERAEEFVEKLRDLAICRDALEIVNML